MRVTRSQSRVNVNRATGRTVGGVASGRRGCKAFLVVNKRKPCSVLDVPTLVKQTDTATVWEKKTRSGLHGAMLNVCTVNSTGAVTLLEHELSRYNIDIAGLHEARWLGRSTVLWSERDDNLHY